MLFEGEVSLYRRVMLGTLLEMLAHRTSDWSPAEAGLELNNQRSGAAAANG